MKPLRVKFEHTYATGWESDGMGGQMPSGSKTILLLGTIQAYIAIERATHAVILVESVWENKNWVRRSPDIWSVPINDLTSV